MTASGIAATGARVRDATAARRLTPPGRSRRPGRGRGPDCCADLTRPDLTARGRPHAQRERGSSYRRGTDGRLSDLETLVHTESGDQKTAVVDTVLAVAEETGASPAQVSVAWLRERAARATTSYVLIIGPRNTAQLEDYLGALEVDLTDGQYNRLTEVSAVPLGVPHEASAAVRDTVQGGGASVVTGPVAPVA
ncbi:aldo/keto reductase [Streptomyces sp. NPDC096153]|uniref:aldo/keto reductase n=1 Tax=Streptomyces sp. NPDC096153 TaxID=3155548 RepID=UPI0033334D43